MQEREQIIKGAQAEAEKIVTMARDRAEYMINSDGWVTLAKERGEQMLSDAQRDAQSTREEIEQYAVEVLGNLEQQLQAATPSGPQWPAGTAWPASADALASRQVPALVSVNRPGCGQC